MCRMAATRSGQAWLSAAQCAALHRLKPAYPAVGPRLDLAGTRSKSCCGAFDCRVGDVEVDRSIGRLLGATDWGGVQGVCAIAVTRLTWLGTCRTATPKAARRKAGAWSARSLSAVTGSSATARSVSEAPAAPTAAGLSATRASARRQAFTVSFAPMQFCKMTTTRSPRSRSRRRSQRRRSSTR